jgi:hypothetical protein
MFRIDDRDDQGFNRGAAEKVLFLTWTDLGLAVSGRSEESRTDIVCISCHII